MSSRISIRRLCAGLFALALSLSTATDRAVAGSFVRADFNTDGSFDITDAVSVLDYLFLSGGTSTCLDAGDSNDDGVVDVADALYSLGFLFLGGSAPPPPFPSCGEDPTQTPSRARQHQPAESRISAKFWATVAVSPQGSIRAPWIRVTTSTE